MSIIAGPENEPIIEDIVAEPEFEIAPTVIEEPAAEPVVEEAVELVAEVAEEVEPEPEVSYENLVDFSTLPPPTAIVNFSMAGGAADTTRVVLLEDGDPGSPRFHSRRRCHCAADTAPRRNRF